MSTIVNFILHMDQQLPGIINSLGVWTYLVLFLIIFIETGLVILPFLPGDSLLFTAGAIAALPGAKLNPWLVYVIVAVAAILGDSTNYWIGDYLGPKVFTGRYRWIKKEYLERTQSFYERHGRKTIFLARFVPIVRSFAPFVAGIGSMHYVDFLRYNIFGGLTWTALFFWGGYFFGNVSLIKSHFSLFIVLIIVFSTLPAIYEVLKERGKKKSTAMG